MIRVLLSMLVLATFVIGCGDTEKPKNTADQGPETKATWEPDPENLVKVSYAGSKWYGHAPVWVGLKKGWFANAGFEVEKVAASRSAERIQLLASGDAHFASLGEIAMLGAMAQGDTGFFWIGNQNIAPGNEGLVAREGIKDLASLKGKRVAINLNSSVHITVAMLLKDHGLSLNDIEVVAATNEEVATLFEKGEVDAAAIWEPFYSRLRAVKGAKVLGTDRDTSIYKNYGTMSGPDMLCFSRKWTQANPVRARALLKAYYRCVDWCNHNLDELVEIVALETGKTSPEAKAEVRAALEKFSWLGWDQQDKAISNLVEQSKDASQVLIDIGTLTKAPEAKNWLFPEIYQED